MQKFPNVPRRSVDDAPTVTVSKRPIQNYLDGQIDDERMFTFDYPFDKKKLTNIYRELLVDHGSNTIHGLQEQFDMLRTHDKLVRSDQIEQSFNDMRKIGYGRKPKGPTSPFDGVGCTEDFVDGFFINVANINGQEARFHDIEALMTFFKKHLMKLT